MSALQQALREGRLSEITDKLFVKAKYHPKYPNLVMFKYDMVNSPMDNPIVQECRGCILDSAHNWDYVARPFDKFFNFAEGLAAVLDWESAKVMEKLDGSLMILYHYDCHWHVASSGLPDAGGQLNNYDTTFKELFWKIFNDNMYDLPFTAWTDCTFMFEMMSPYNRVVVPHTESKLALIGIRNRNSGKELSVAEACDYNWPKVKSFSLNTFEDICKSFETFDGIDQEGYVVVDKNFNRIKVKHPGYVAIHHLKGDDGPSHKKMFKIVCTGELSEVLTYFPEWRPVFDEVSEVFEDTLKELSKDYDRITNIVNGLVPAGSIANVGLLQKEFASHAVKTKCPDALFRMRAGKIKSFREYFETIGVDQCMKIMGKKEWNINVP